LAETDVIYLRTYDPDLVERLKDQAHFLKMGFSEYCITVLRNSLYPDDELITTLTDRAFEIESQKKYSRKGLLPGEREVR
jgi:hypothetical protein